MNMHVTFSEVGSKAFSAFFKHSGDAFASHWGNVQPLTEYVGGDPYMGAYTVTPKVDAQGMATKGKVMTEDVTIEAIPFYEVSNTSGGNTVFIAKEI